MNWKIRSPIPFSTACIGLAIIPYVGEFLKSSHKILTCERDTWPVSSLFALVRKLLTTNSLQKEIMISLAKLTIKIDYLSSKTLKSWGRGRQEGDPDIMWTGICEIKVLKNQKH